MSDAMSHAAIARDCFRSAEQERYGALSDAELEAENNCGRAALAAAEGMTRAMNEMVRELREQSDQLVTVWLERRHG